MCTEFQFCTMKCSGDGCTNIWQPPPPAKKNPTYWTVYLKIGYYGKFYVIDILSLKKQTTGEIWVLDDAKELSLFVSDVI